MADSPTPGPHGPSVRIGVLSNTSNARKQARAAALDSLLRCHQHVRHLQTPSAADIGPALDDLAAAGTEVLVINGGDGTVAHVLTALLNGSAFSATPLLALLPGGSSNIAVGDVGFRGNLRRSSLRLCQWANGHLATRIVRRPALRVMVPERDTALYGLVFGAGAVVDGIDYWHERVKSRGMRGPQSSFVAMLGTLRAIVARDTRLVQPVPVRVAFDDEPLGDPQRAFIVVSSSLERLFLGVRPFWDQAPSGLHNTIISDRPLRFPRLLPSILRGRYRPGLDQRCGYLSRRARSLELDLGGRFTLDGDIYVRPDGAAPLQLSEGPVLDFLQPL